MNGFAFKNPVKAFSKVNQRNVGKSPSLNPSKAILEYQKSFDDVSHDFQVQFCMKCSTPLRILFIYAQ